MQGPLFRHQACRACTSGGKSGRQVHDMGTQRGLHPRGQPLAGSSGQSVCYAKPLQSNACRKPEACTCTYLLPVLHLRPTPSCPHAAREPPHAVHTQVWLSAAHSCMPVTSAVPTARHGPPAHPLPLHALLTPPDSFPPPQSRTPCPPCPAALRRLPRAWSPTGQFQEGRRTPLGHDGPTRRVPGPPHDGPARRRPEAALWHAMSVQQQRLPCARAPRPATDVRGCQ